MKNLEYVDINLNLLSEKNKNKYLKFYELLNQKEEKEEVLFLYRGTMYSKIKERLSHSDLIEEKIFERAFYFGEKANFCSEKSIKNDKKQTLQDINDCSNNTLGNLFDEIRFILFQERLDKNVQKELSKEFQEYFKNDNKEIFVRKLNKFNAEDKLQIRDYYLYLLHTANTFKFDTPLVSTSVKKSVAKYFKNGNTADKRIIFHYFVSFPFHCSVIAPWKIDEAITKVQKFKLPLYKSKGLFPKQKEIAVKGGLFPHNILGIELVAEKKFIVNNHLLECDESWFEYMVANGIVIDQTKFKSEIKKTPNENYIQRDFEGCISSKKVNKKKTYKRKYCFKKRKIGLNNSRM